MQTIHTAEIERETVCTGEPCETFISIIIVGFVDILGILFTNLTANKELRQTT